MGLPPQLFFMNLSPRFYAKVKTGLCADERVVGPSPVPAMRLDRTVEIEGIEPVCFFFPSAF